ncbi:hypothetical protein IQ06DRAFT_73154 [Phaeosphaeriaceae sp. SRC1lsM3a]|nr:hypothetical protein IQ06DRAFT_73154 [Stagonospora sp. SRC1lsM3a]
MWTDEYHKLESVRYRAKTQHEHILRANGKNSRRIVVVSLFSFCIRFLAACYLVLRLALIAGSSLSMPRPKNLELLHRVIPCNTPRRLAWVCSSDIALSRQLLCLLSSLAATICPEIRTHLEHVPMSRVPGCSRNLVDKDESPGVSSREQIGTANRIA